MRPPAARLGHHPLLIGLHWLTAVAVLAAYASGGDPSRAGQIIGGQLHVASGLAVFGLTALRLPVRWLAGAPPAEPWLVWQRRMARAVQTALYVLLLLVPLAGWAALAGASAQFVLLGWPLPQAQATWLYLIGQAHVGLGDALVGLAGAHALAALLHHYVLGDDVLRRMSIRRG